MHAKFLHEQMNSIVTEAHGNTYHGIKRLWQSEVSGWLTNRVNGKYSIYKLPNCNYNKEEYWAIDDLRDLDTLKMYLTDYNRAKDFDKKEKLA